MTEKQKETLQEARALILEVMNDLSQDFANERALSDTGYFSDMVTEYSDSAVDIYYSDQYKYWNEHTEECENALLELLDGDSIAQTIKRDGLYILCCQAGVAGQFLKNERELFDDKENIIKVLIIDYLLNINEFLTVEEIEKIAAVDCDEMDEYAEEVNKQLKLGEE